jgi:hypothetical protein
MNADSAPTTFSDNVDRINDFLARHGGPTTRATREGTSANGSQGWSEHYAADGYALRCEWSEAGGRTEMNFTELSPTARP